MGSLALDPSGSGAFVASMSNAYSAYWGGKVTTFAWESAGYVYTDKWENDTHNTSPSSIAWDSAGCIWAPNYSSEGSISCLNETDGLVAREKDLGDYVEAVALDAGENLYVSIDTTIYQVDKSSLVPTSYYMLSLPILDMVFDITGEAYVLTKDGTIHVIDRGGTTHSTFATTILQGKLAISPNGALFLQTSDPPDTDTLSTRYTMWPLP
jgi:hypothetical protein